MRRKSGLSLQSVLGLLAVVALFCAAFQPQPALAAGTDLTVTSITWNVIGLDSNNVNVGPNDFPVGARVCNTGGSPTSVSGVNFVWDDGGGVYTSSVGANPYINLRDGTLSSLYSVASPCPWGHQHPGRATAQQSPWWA